MHGHSPPSVVEARELRVRRGGAEVLHGLTFALAAGRITGVLGPSGCGKSTLLRAIVGVQAAVTGTLTVLGQSAGAAPLRGRIGYMTQAPSVYADLTVAENLRYFAAIDDAPAASVRDALARVDLAPVAGRRVATLSGGQRARVSLAAALIGRPPLLVLDEPTVGLDPVLRAGLWAFFAELASAGTALLVSSHVMDEASRCDDLLLLREGRLLAQDTPAGLLARTGADDLESAFLALAGGRRRAAEAARW